MPKERKVAGIARSLILTAVGIVAFWGLAVPPFEFPDEQAHLGTVSFLVTQGRSPTYKEPDMTVEMTEVQKLLGVYRNDLGQNKYTYHPEYRVEYTDSFIGKFESDIAALNTEGKRSAYTPVEEAARYPALYYAYGGVFWKIAGSGTLIDRLFAVRVGTWFFAAGMAWFIYKIGLSVYGKRTYAATLTAMTMLQPMYSFVSAGVTSDNLHNLLTLGVIFVGLSVIKKGFTLSLICTSVILIGLDMYTKPQAFILIPVILTAFLLRIVKERRFKPLIGTAILMIVMAVVAREQFETYKGFLNVENIHNASFVEYVRFSVNKLIAQNIVWYWGVFKWLGVVLPPIYWQVANRVALLSVAGMAVYYYRVVRKGKGVARIYEMSYLILSAVIYAGVIFWFDWTYHKGWGYSLGIQARYFFPTIVAHMAVILTGITSLGWNKTVRIWLRRLLVIMFVWLQLGGLWRVITVYYDVSSVQTLFHQMSQYKPALAKGDIWYLWVIMYTVSILYLTKTALFPGIRLVQPRRNRRTSSPLRPRTG